MNKKLFGLLFVLGATLAFGAVQQLDRNISPRLSSILAGIVVGPASTQATDTLINANRITRALAASGTIDFAILAAGGCEESSAITVLGARLGDACHVGAPVLTGADAGVLQGDFTCFVSAADAAKVRFCSGSATGDNPASASFEVRILSNN